MIDHFVLQTTRMATEVGSGLIDFGENYGQNTFIGIYAVNSVEVKSQFSINMTYLIFFFSGW